MTKIVERIEPDDSRQFRLHLDRYEFAVTQLIPGNVLDLGCGVGYGTMMLASKAIRCFGVDNDRGAIEVAKEQYNPNNLLYICADAHDHDSYKYGTFHNIVALESLEHMDNPGKVLDGLRTNRLIASCPLNENIGDNPYHKWVWDNVEVFKDFVEEHGYAWIGRSFQQPDNWTGVFSSGP